MRLIDADKLKAHYSWWKGGSREMTMDEAKSDFDCIIDLQPTVDPIKHGRWIVISEYPKKAECSYCGYPTEHELVCWWDYCPNCGADMRGEKNDKR